jgi:uncharacterized protein YndB with AHSA1/START domain
MHVEETFMVGRPPVVVFDYVTNPANLSSWQTSNRSVEQLTDGPPGLGSRFRERTKPPLGKEFEQVTEFTECDRPRRLNVRIVEGPYPGDGTWTFEPDGDGTRVHFIGTAELSGLMKLLQPIASRVMARQFAGYHRNLRQNLERS